MLRPSKLFGPSTAAELDRPLTFVVALLANRDSSARDQVLCLRAIYDRLETGCSQLRPSRVSARTSSRHAHTLQQPTSPIVPNKGFSPFNLVAACKVHQRRVILT